MTTAMLGKVLIMLAMTWPVNIDAREIELAQRLRVSPASFSKAIGFLEEQGLIRRDRSARRERYVVDDDAWYRAWQVSAGTNARLADTALQGAEILGAGTPAGARLGEMGRFLQAVGDVMIRAGEDWWRGGSRPERGAAS